MSNTPEERALDAAQIQAPLRNYARFKELREMVGMSQTDLAREVSVAPRTVRRWETPDTYIPDDSWETLEQARARQLEICAVAVRKILSVTAEHGAKPDTIAIPYHIHDNMARANARLVAHELERRGYHIRIVPDENEKSRDY